MPAKSKKSIFISLSLPVIGVLVGILIGSSFPLTLPAQYSQFMSVALLACLDSVFGGLRSALEDKFDNEIFITGFFTNALLAVGLVYVGYKLGIDLYYVSVLAFGLRIFQNLAIIRRHLLKK
ncbi:small basic family protein [Selenomonadales bacterium OttesenSCG-928-I06]|nr:small basic family protein [Selenomonadales bacterium OttesenSCG-928-I06]